MNRNDNATTKLRMFTIAALAMTVAACGLASCSSDSDSASDTTSKGATSGQTQDSGSAADNSTGDSTDDTTGDKGDKADLPAGWPDVPMPDYDEVTGGSSDEDYWNAMLIVDPKMNATGEEMMSAYRTKLESAGYTATESDSPSMLGFSNGTYRIDAYSSGPGILNVTVAPVEG